MVRAKERYMVTFFSPGTFFDETSSKELKKGWCKPKTENEATSEAIEEAVKMAREVTERYGAKPFAFQFETDILKPKKNGEKRFEELKTSKLYYLGGILLTLEDIKARKNKKDDILISDMESNHIEKVIQNDNSYRTVRPYRPNEDVILDVKL